MPIKLLSVKNDLDKRFEDIQAMMNILEKNEKVNSQLILKSSLMLMLYNAVEGTMSNLLIELFDNIKSRQISINNLPINLQKLIYKFHLKKIGGEVEKLKKFNNYNDIEICDISYLEINKYLKLFSGNLDSRSIKELSSKLGVTLSDKMNEPTLLQVKSIRNKLAHGETRFSNTCQDITLEESKYLCEKVKKYLETIIEQYENFLNIIPK